ncbi:unnamed protein product [Paramecium pentaurelia]|uniref:Uncharacterized protein n=1 Tax=Paramecium pentaurelia TaxID=43138 RepID=A0A8S1UC81_9CILI|nr:unnamed protein product [Paramecium pentaurelia]
MSKGPKLHPNQPNILIDLDLPYYVNKTQIMVFGQSINLVQLFQTQETKSNQSYLKVVSLFIQ